MGSDWTVHLADWVAMGECGALEVQFESLNVEIAEAEANRPERGGQ